MEDDNDFDFSIDDLSPEERKEIDKEYREQKKKIETSEIYIKANEILDTVIALVETLDEEDKNIYERTLLESAYMLAPKLAGAIGSDNWLICMENASLIRYHAQYLLTSTSGLKMFTKVQKDYIQILRTEMEEFRTIFNKWVKTFHLLDKEEYEDEWGLFIRE